LPLIYDITIHILGFKQDTWLNLASTIMKGGTRPLNFEVSGNRSKPPGTGNPPGTLDNEHQDQRLIKTVWCLANMMTQEIVVICTGEVMLEDDSWTGGELMFKGYKHGVFQILSDGKITYGEDADNLSVGLQLYSKTRCIFKGYSFGGTEVIKIADFSPSVKALAHFKMSAFSIINGRRTNYLKFAFIGGDSLKKFLDGFQQVCDDHNLKNAFTDPVWIDLVTKAFQSASICRGCEGRHKMHVFRRRRR
jgi:hypothetical protein